MKGESHSLSLAKKAVAFFRISRSIRSRRFSRRSCTSSSRSLRRQRPLGTAPSFDLGLPHPTSQRRLPQAQLHAPSARRSCRCLGSTAPSRPCTRPRTSAASASAPSPSSTPIAHFRAFRSVHETGASPAVLRDRREGREFPALPGSNLGPTAVICHCAAIPALGFPSTPLVPREKCETVKTVQCIACETLRYHGRTAMNSRGLRFATST